MVATTNSLGARLFFCGERSRTLGWVGVCCVIVVQSPIFFTYFFLLSIFLRILKNDRS